MDAFFAGLLGLIQGLTEFLPISSSGHLVVFQQILGFSEPEVFFDVCLHIGTLVAVCVVFREDIRSILAELIRLPALLTTGGGFRELTAANARIRTAMLIFWGCLPTAMLGLGFKQIIEEIFGAVWITGAMLVVTGGLLWLTRRTSTSGRTIRRMTIGDALLIGLVQGLAILPGISRSGATISAALFLGIDRQLAGRFSFLLSIPAILGALLLSLDAEMLDTSMSAGAILIGAVTAAISGYIALKWLLKIVDRGKLHLFSPYCWGVGGFVLIWRLL